MTHFPRIAAILVLLTTSTPAANAAPGSCYHHVRSAPQRRLVTRESRGNPHAANPHSSAFGCLQLLRSTRNTMGRRLGINPDTTDPAQQMRMGSLYIDLRYGSDERALAHSLHHGWF